MIFWIIYTAGFIVNYILTRWDFKKLSDLGWGWGDIFLNTLYSFGSWLSVLATLLGMCIYHGCKYDSKIKPPKWL